MLVATSVFDGDCDQAIRLYRWIRKLSPSLKAHDCLLVADPETPFDKVVELKNIALDVFRDVGLETLPESKKGWPDAAEYAFKFTSKYIAAHWHSPFLWMESDCVPVKPTWLDEIAKEHDGHSYMGHIYDAEAWQPHLPNKLMSGIAVYPSNAGYDLSFPENAPLPWDVNNAIRMTQYGKHTNLIKHFWGQPDLAPLFVARKALGQPVNALPLSFIPPECVLFHRCKNSSLIDLLDRQFFPHEHLTKITVAFPVHNGDIQQAIRHAEWLVKMGRKHEHEALISHDVSCNAILLNQFQKLLRQVFSKVDSFVYPRPPIQTYPACANWAWQNTALKMQQLGKPWFWVEADSVALVLDWIEQIQTEYDQAGSPWMGPHVKGMNHSNGVMVYPKDAASRMTTAMRLINEGAFDYTGASEYMPYCHDASHIIQHVWSILNDECCEVGGGCTPASMTLEQANRWIRKPAVIYHRIKSNDLTNLLMSGQYKH